MARKCDFRAPASLTSAFNEVTISLVSARKRDYKRVALIGYCHEPGPCMIVGCELTLQNRGGVLSFGFYRVRLRYLVRFYSLSRVLSFLLCITCLFFAGAHRGFSTWYLRRDLGDGSRWAILCVFPPASWPRSRSRISRQFRAKTGLDQSWLRGI